MLRFYQIVIGLVICQCMFYSNMMMFIFCTTYLPLQYYSITMGLLGICVVVILLRRYHIRYFIAFIFGVLNLIITIFTDNSIFYNFITEQYKLDSTNPSYWYLYHVLLIQNMFLLIWPSLLLIYPMINRKFGNCLQDNNIQEDSVVGKRVHYKLLPIFFAFFWVMYSFCIPMPTIHNVWGIARMIMTVLFGVLIAYKLKQGDENSYWVMTAMPFAVLVVVLSFPFSMIIRPSLVDFTLGFYTYYLSLVAMVFIIPFAVISIIGTRIRRCYNENILISNIQKS